MKSLADHIVDVAQNSIRAKSTWIEISIEEDYANDICCLQISDNGNGMGEEVLKQAANPFFTTRKTRKVGMGLALLKYNAETANGYFSISSASGKGTTVKAIFKHSHFDRPPFGDIWNAVYQVMFCNPHTEIVYIHKTGKGEFSISTSEIAGALDGVPMQNREIGEAITSMIRNNIKSIQ